MQVSIKGTDRKIKIDARFAKMLPDSVWMVTTRQGKQQPTCRHNGRTMTVVRAVGLMAGMPGCQYILPRNGDWFDCRVRNIFTTDAMPQSGDRVYRNNSSGVRNIQAGGNGYWRVVLVINGRQTCFGQSKDLEEAKKIRDAARKANGFPRPARPVPVANVVPIYHSVEL